MFSRRRLIHIGGASLLASPLAQIVNAQSSTPGATATNLENMLHLAVPELPQAAEGAVEVVLVGQGTSRSVGVVVHNATDQVVGIADISGIGRDANGALFAVSDTSIVAPYELAPGEYSLGLVAFDKDLDASIEVDFEVKAETPGEGFMDIVDIPVTEVSIDGDKVIGIVENTSNLEASALVAIVGIFFDQEGAVCGWFRTYLNDSIQPGRIGTFSSSSVEGVASQSYALAASGWAG